MPFLIVFQWSLRFMHTLCIIKNNTECSEITKKVSAIKGNYFCSHFITEAQNLITTTIQNLQVPLKELKIHIFYLLSRMPRKSR